MADGQGLFLGLDVGTQGTKALLLDGDGRRVIARAARSYGTLPGLAPGASEQHPETWIDAIRGVADDLAARTEFHPDAVRGIGVSGQQHGLVMLDEQLRVVRPAKLWNDTSVAAQADQLSDHVGMRVPISYTATKILWMRQHEPEAWSRTAHILLPHDYVNLRLTGVLSMEPGDASGTGLFNSARREFDPNLIDFVDPRLASMVPRLLRPGELAGRLSPSGADILGLPPGIAVAAGSGDNMASAIGSGATRPGPVVVSIGTSGTVFTHSDHPIIDPTGIVADFCDATGGWLPLVATLSMTEVTEATLRLFPDQDHRSLTEAAAGVPAGADGLLMIPYLAGERSPDLPHARGGLLGITGANLTPGALFRAALEGTTVNLLLGLDRARELGVEMAEIRVVGGGARNPLWRRIVADAAGAPVRQLTEPESAALGVAIQAQWSVLQQSGTAVDIGALAEEYVQPAGDPVEPDVDTAPVYQRLRQRLRDQIELLRSTTDR